MEIPSELNDKVFSVIPDELAENITTQGIDLLSLPQGCQLHIGKTTIIELTALHNPCVQIENFQTGMLKEVISKDEHGKIIRKLGVMGVVSSGGQVQPNDEITIQLPAQPHKNLEYVW